MRIACPSCDAVYNVPDALLAGPTRAVRCVRCGTEWAPQPLPPPRPALLAPSGFPSVAASPVPDAPPPDAPPEIGPPPRVEPKLSSYRSRTEPRLDAGEDGDARPPPRDDETTLRRRRGAVAGWILSVVVLVALAVAAVGWRTQVMAAWPPSQRVYGVLGLR
jgi:predicted Zn finger-like uncharacterized protein